MTALTFDFTFNGYWREPNIGRIPNESGIYCVYECTYNMKEKSVTIHRLIYIGESNDVNNRIKNHEKWQDWERYVRTGNQLCFSFGNANSLHRERVEAALINEHKPPVNSEYKSSFPFDTTTIRTSERNAKLKSNFIVFYH